MNIEKTLARNLTLLRSLSAEMSRDTFIAHENLNRVALSYTNGEGSVDDSAFWIRATIRSFMSQVEGISFGIRNTVLALADDHGVELTNRTRAELSELKYDKNSDSIIPEFFSKGPKETLKLALRYFPLLFGANWRLNTNDLGWSDFLRILQMRHRVTHPTRIECFYPAQALPHLIPSILWFHATILEMFEACASSLGVPASRKRILPDLAPFRSMSSTSIDLEPSLYQKIEAYGSNSLAYVNEVFRLVHLDVCNALDLLKHSIPKRRLTPLTVFACRNAVRSLFAGVEGMTAALIFFILAAEKRGTIVLAESQRAQLTETKDECVRAAIAASLFSNFFGHSLIARTQGEEWRALNLAKKFRDRFTHPRSLHELDVKPGTITILVNALEWYIGDFLETTEINVDRWVAIEGNLPINEILPENLAGTDIPSED